MTSRCRSIRTRSGRPPLLEHLRRAFNHVIQHRGPHGLPLIGRADWNDCLNLNCYSTNPDEAFQIARNNEGSVAESVLIAGMFAFIGDEYAALLRHLGKTTEAKVAEAHIDEMRDTVVRHGFDGRWFLRAYDSHGRKVGSSENEEGQIFAEPQAFCAMAGIGKDTRLVPFGAGRGGGAIGHAVRHRLAAAGLLALLPGAGRNQLVSAGLQGERGHFLPLQSVDHDCRVAAGRGQQAYDYYRRISPAFLDDQQQNHRTEPYVYAQMIAGPDSVCSGQAKNSWLTGTRRMELRGHDALHAGRAARAQRPANYAHDCARDRLVSGYPPLPRSGVYDCRSLPAKMEGVPEVFVNGSPAGTNLVPYAERGACVSVECHVHGC